MKAMIFQNAMSDTKIKTVVLVFGSLLLVWASYTVGVRSSTPLAQANNTTSTQTQVTAHAQQAIGQSQAPQLLFCQYGECKPIS